MDLAFCCLVYIDMSFCNYLNDMTHLENIFSSVDRETAKYIMISIPYIVLVRVSTINEKGFTTKTLRGTKLLDSTYQG